MKSHLTMLHLIYTKMIKADENQPLFVSIVIIYLNCFLSRLKLIKQKILDKIYHQISKNKTLDSSTVINVFADPRSGSTWLVELLNQIPRSFILDEPLHLKKVKAFKALDFCWRQHIPEHENWDQVKEIFENKLFKGRLLNYGLCYKNTISEVRNGKTIINKFIRGKALLPWLCQNFEFEYAPIVLVRHPLAMIASMKKHQAWDYTFERTPLLSCPFPEIYNEHLDFMASLETQAAQLIAYWCINNNLLLKHSKNNTAWISINYEDLVINPESTINEIFKRWNLAVPEVLIGKVRNPSQTTIDHTQIKNPQLQIRKWENELSERELETYHSILEYFDVSYYSIANAMPIVKAAKVHQL